MKTFKKHRSKKLRKPQVGKVVRIQIMKQTKTWPHNFPAAENQTERENHE